MIWRSGIAGSRSSDHGAGRVLGPAAATGPVTATVGQAEIGGWLPPCRCPSRRLLRSRDEGPGLITRSKITPIPGPRPHRGLEVGVTKVALGVACDEALSGRKRNE